MMKLYGEIFEQFLPLIFFLTYFPSLLSSVLWGIRNGLYLQIVTKRKLRNIKLKKIATAPDFENPIFSLNFLTRNMIFVTSCCLHHLRFKVRSGQGRRSIALGTGIVNKLRTQVRFGLVRGQSIRCRSKCRQLLYFIYSCE